MVIMIDEDDENTCLEACRSVLKRPILKLKRLNCISCRHQGGPRGPVTTPGPWPRPRPAQQMDQYAGTLLSSDIGNMALTSPSLLELSCRPGLFARARMSSWTCSCFCMGAHAIRNLVQEQSCHPGHCPRSRMSSKHCFHQHVCHSKLLSCVRIVIFWFGWSVI